MNMAISVQPVDGLINRLLQQNSRPASVSEKRLHHAASRSQDQVTISAKAETHRQGGQPVKAPTSGQEKALESHLLNLYKMNDSLGV